MSDDSDIPELSSPPRMRNPAVTVNYAGSTASSDAASDASADTRSLTSMTSTPMHSNRQSMISEGYATASSEGRPIVVSRHLNATLGPSADPFRRRSNERHSMHSTMDFASRRSPKEPGKWTDMFTSKRIKKRIKHFREAGLEDASSTCSSVGTLEEDNLNSYSVEMLKEQIVQIFKDSNMKQNIIDEQLTKMDEAKMRTLIRLSRKNESSQKATQRSPKAMIDRLVMILDNPRILERKNDVVTLKVALMNESVEYLKEFANYPDESGKNGFQLICSLIKKLLAELRNLDHEQHAHAAQECMSLLTEVARSCRAIINCYPGLVMAMRSESQMVACLLEILWTVNERKSEGQESEAVILRSELLKILSSFALLNKDGVTYILEMSGRERLLKDLTWLSSTKSKQPRFKPIVDSLKFCPQDDYDFMFRVLMLITLIIDCAPEGFSDEMRWQLRMRMRSEAMRAGFGKYLKMLAEKSRECEHLMDAFTNYDDLREADINSLHNKYDNIQGEYDTLDGCFTQLASTSENTVVEPYVLGIMQTLMLIPEDVSVRVSYFRMIEILMNEIVLHKHAADPDFESQFVFETKIDEMLETLQDSEITKKLEKAVQAKQEAVAMQEQYWKKLDEFRAETQLLRKHITDPSAPLPPPTVCNLQQPTISHPPPQAPPAIGGGPPPPPPPPPGLLGGGPPPPPPPPPGLLGGPGPPPPPPGLLGGGPPPPPPPPPGMLGGKGPPAPPPPPGFGGPVFVPPPAVPEYIPPKKKRNVDVPMRNFPWNSNAIDARDLPRDCFWAKTAEEKLASDALFAQFKEKFASSRITKGDDSLKSGKQAAAKKAKVPLVIQDDKIIQALAILRGSAKLSYSDWKRGLLEIDEKILTSNLLQQLRGALPPLDVLKKLAEVESSQIEDMPEGEQFAAELAKINALPLRIDMIDFKMRFQEMVLDIKPGVIAVIEACDEIRKSKGFKTFLELALLFGNYAGQSSKNYKDTYAFKMSVLPKLVGTKDVDNKHTLLHHMIETFKKMDPANARFAQEDLYHCNLAARLSEDDIQQRVQQLRQNTTKLENCLKTYQKQRGNDRFEEVLSPFLAKAQSDLSLVESLYNKMKSDWASLAKFYAFDNDKKYKMADFFGDMKTFKEQYEIAYRELEEESRKNAQEKEKKCKKEKEKDKRPPLRDLQSGGHSVGVTPLQTAANSVGVLDELDSMMHAGGLAKFLNGPKTPRAAAPNRKPGSSASRTAALQRQRSRAAEAQMMMTPTRNNPMSQMHEQIVRVRRKGAPTVEEIRSYQKSPPNDQENRRHPGDVPSADELLARLNQF